MRTLVLHDSAVPDFDYDRVKVNDRVERFKWPMLPGEDLIKNFISDFADCLMTEFRANGARQVMLNVADGHATCVKTHDHRVKPPKTSLAFRNKPRRERTSPVTGHIKNHVTSLSFHCFAARPITRVRMQFRIRVAFLVTQVGSHFRL